MLKHSLSFKPDNKKEKQLKETLDTSVKAITKSIARFSEYYIQYNLLAFLPFVLTLHFKQLYIPLQPPRTSIVLIVFFQNYLKTQKCL